MYELLKECLLQLQYLSDKFAQTGTTNALLSRIQYQLDNYELTHPVTQKEIGKQILATLKKIHIKSVYQLSKDDDRPYHLPYSLYDEVNLAIKRGQEVFESNGVPLNKNTSKLKKEFDAKKYIDTHADVKIYYDTDLKRNYILLGYFGGGSVNIMEANELAHEFSKRANVEIGSVHIDEILSSRRFKGFKFLLSEEENQKPIEGANQTTGVYAWFRD